MSFVEFKEASSFIQELSSKYQSRTSSYQNRPEVVSR